ncbi:protein TIS11-like [Watersipora subatra]|uniref:protein TIS11-like n=1 Tax=Watersipora subatra TaxID=2589382 RepID=UPI00355C352F
MVSERFPHYSGDFPKDYWAASQTLDMPYLNQARRWSVSSLQDKPSIAYDGMQRRCSVQVDRSYLQSSGNTLKAINSQQRSHCQKPVLRNVVSAPQPVDGIDPRQLLPRTPVVQRSEIMPAPSIESVDSTAVETARYKTELCRPFEETGQCRYGGKCQFAHGKPELRCINRHPKYKTELCRTFHTTGLCSYGHRCNFIHNDEERRGPAQATSSTALNRHRGSLPMGLPVGILGSESSSSSITSGSPSQSPPYLQDDTLARLSPAPSFGSDGASIASTTYTPPGSPKFDLSDYQFNSPLDMGLSLSHMLSK